MISLGHVEISEFLWYVVEKGVKSLSGQEYWKEFTL